MPINANIKVGTLIQSDSHIGVIRYIGPVNELKDNTGNSSGYYVCAINFQINLIYFLIL